MKSSSSFLSDLERDDSCALYLLEQIPHILTFKDVGHWLEHREWNSERQRDICLACQNPANVHRTGQGKRVERSLLTSTFDEDLLRNSSHGLIRCNYRLKDLCQLMGISSFRMPLNHCITLQRQSGKTRSGLVLSISKVSPRRVSIRMASSKNSFKKSPDKHSILPSICSRWQRMARYFHRRSPIERTIIFTYSISLGRFSARLSTSRSCWT